MEKKELNDEELENVNGGGVVTDFLKDVFGKVLGFNRQEKNKINGQNGILGGSNKKEDNERFL